MFRCNSNEYKKRFGPLLISPGLTFLVAFSLTGWGYLVDGNSAAIRVAASMMMPTGAFWLMLLMMSIWAFLSQRKVVGVFLAVVFIGLTLLGNVRVSNAIMRTVEWPIEQAADSQLISPEPIPLQTIVVLGGGTLESPDGRPELGRAGERIFTAVQFWHAQRVSTIITTGSSVVGSHPSIQGKELLISAGIPESAIITVDGFNTVGEMKNLQSFFESNEDQFSSESNVGLITSASHMNRAIRLAADQGLDFVPLPVAYHQKKEANTKVYDWVPMVTEIDTSTIGVREWIAWAMRR